MLIYVCIAFVAFGIGAIVGAFLMIALLTGMTAHVERPSKNSYWADGRYR